MTQSQLDTAVAAATGEPVRRVRRHGFGLVARRPADLEPEDLCLRVACPFCGRHVAYPGVAAAGALALGECLACDVYFDVAPDDVYAAPAGHVGPAPDVR